MKRDMFNGGVSAKPLVTARLGTEASEPYVVEVKHGQWDADPSQKTLIIQAQARPDIGLEKAKSVFQHAAVDVFGDRPAAPCFLDWYDPKNVAETGGRPVLTLASLTLIFFPGTVAASGDVSIDSHAKAFILVRRPDAMAREYSAAMKRWHSRL